MANVFLNLPSQAGNGAGAAVDVSGMAPEKTIVIAGSWRLPPSISVEFNNDAAAAGSWQAIRTVQVGAQIKVELACRWMRVVVSDYREGQAPVVNVGGINSGCNFDNLPVTAGNGTGAPVNVSTRGLFKTVMCADRFQGTANVEISEDGGTTWATIMSFSGRVPGAQSQAFAADFMRVTRVGCPVINPGLPRINVGSFDPTVLSDGIASNCLIYRPGSGETGPVVFASWASLYAELQAKRAESNNSGCFTIAFDDSIVSPAVIPPGAYDMDGVTWEAWYLISNGTNVAVEVTEGCTFTQLRRWDGTLLVTFTGTTPPITDLDVGDTTYMTLGASFLCTGGGPFMAVSLPGATVIMVMGVGAKIIDGGAGQAVIDIADGCAVAMPDAAAFVEVQANTISGTIAAVFIPATAASGVSLVSETQPAFLGVMTPLNLTKWRINPEPLPPAAPYTADVTLAAANTLAIVDTTGLPGPLEVTLPLAASADVNRGQSVIIKNVGTDGVVRVLAQGSDTINRLTAAPDKLVWGYPGGVLAFVSDGVSDWHITTMSVYSPPEQWGVTNMQASVVLAAMSALVSQNFDQLRMIRPGSIIGMAVRLSTPILTGSLTVTVSLGVGLGTLSLTLTSGDSTAATQQPTIDYYQNGEDIGISYATSADFTPVGLNAEAWLEVCEIGFIPGAGP